MLPFIVHRIASFIRIGEFRQWISDETSLGIIKNNNRFVEFDNSNFFDHLVICFLIVYGNFYIDSRSPNMENVLEIFDDVVPHFSLKYNQN